MDCLECYTLTDQLTKGIRVADFESIITSDDLEIVQYASLQTCPLFESKAKSIEEVAPLSLCFLHAKATDGNGKKDGVFIAVDMTKWLLSGSRDASTAVDLCGLGGKVLLYYPAGAKTGLLNKHQSNKCLVISDKAIPEIVTVNRANLLASAAGVLQDSKITTKRLAQPKERRRASRKTSPSTRKSTS